MDCSFSVKPIDNLSINEIVILQQKNEFVDGWSKEMLNDGFDKGGLKAIGVNYKNKLIAFLTYSIADNFAEIQDVLVDKEFRQKGIASELINKLIEIIKNQKIEKIFLEVREGNVGAINLYQKNGFNKISIRKKYYSNGENAQVMQKIL